MKLDPNYVPELPKERITDEEHLADVAATMKAHPYKLPTTTLAATRASMHSHCVYLIVQQRTATARMLLVQTQQMNSRRATVACRAARPCLSWQVGDRCQVNPGGKRGSVQFVGKIPAIAPGFWVGVQYDEPVGKNDGTVKGDRFFECPPKYGGFLRPNKIDVGDFPEEDLFGSEDDEDAS